jgi:CheY-like chemotaxis protein
MAGDGNSIFIMQGKPWRIAFGLAGNLLFSCGLALPVFKKDQQPDFLPALTCSPHRPVTKPAAPAAHESKTVPYPPTGSGGPAESKKQTPNMTSSNLLLVEDRDGLIRGIFQKTMKAKSASVRMASGTDEALNMAAEAKPRVVITTRNPAGNLGESRFSDQLRQNLGIPTLFLTREGQNMRLEDGWLDLHIRCQGDPAKNIMELVRQFYGNAGQDS